MILKPFEIIKNGKSLDYRLGHVLPEDKLRKELTQRGFEVKKLSLASRHYTGHVHKNSTSYFVKIATSEGMSLLTQHEVEWSKLFQQAILSNLSFSVPKVIDSGFLLQNYFFFVSEFVHGELLVNYPASRDTTVLTHYLKELVEMALTIEQVHFSEPLVRPDAVGRTYMEQARAKTQAWYDAIPIEIRNKYQVEKLLQFVQKEITTLKATPRHGDFTPWHIFLTPEKRLVLIDGEHASSEAVEHYDLGYLTQRVFSVLKNQELAHELLKIAETKKVSGDKLRVILAMRAIGGFLDESLTEHPDYLIHEAFVKELVKL